MKPYYQDGKVTIYHGDCRDVLPSLRADAVVTDPPFKISQAYSAAVDADNLDAVASLIDVSRLLLGCTTPGSVLVAFYDNRIMPFGMDAMRRAGWQYLRFLAFYRRWGNAHQMNGWMSTTDPVLVFGNPGERPRFPGGKWRHDTYVKASPDVGAVDHPARKPTEFVAQLVERVTPPGGVVLDPYLGSGSTAVAAVAAGVRCVGIEAEERYCELAARRCSQEMDFHAANAGAVPRRGSDVGTSPLLGGNGGKHE